VGGAQNRSAPAGTNPADPSVIVGRSSELSLIGDRWTSSRFVEPGHCCWPGAGIGKTTLLQALERQARQRGIAVHR
jgi:hypothetical protein